MFEEVEVDMGSAPLDTFDDDCVDDVEAHDDEFDASLSNKLKIK
jgi:hypothetical protein